MEPLRGESSVTVDKSNNSPTEYINVSGSENLHDLRTSTPPSDEALTTQKNGKTNNKKTKKTLSDLNKNVSESPLPEDSAESSGTPKKRFNRLKDDKSLPARFLDRALQSHMKKYFKRKPKDEKQAEKEEAERKANIKGAEKGSAKKRKKASTSKYVTKQARFARDVQVNSRTLIDQILKK